MEKIVIIGGNAAGMSAASRAKRLRPSLDILILEQSQYISYSTCGVPYFLSGIVADKDALISFSPEELLRERGIRARISSRVTEIFPSKKQVTYIDLEKDEKKQEPFDKLVIATGYSNKTPAIQGLELQGVFSIANLEDGLRIKAYLSKYKPANVVLVGAGYVGLEMAETFRALGSNTTVLERENTVLGGIDYDVSVLVEAELTRQEVRVIKNAEVSTLNNDGTGKVSGVCYGRANERLPANLVLLDTGITPNVALANSSGIRIGQSGAIEVNDFMETSYPYIYAAGNCAETKHLVTGKKFIDALGTVAAKQGRIAGENLAGRKSEFQGALGTCVVKVFDLGIARTGLSENEAEQMGYKAVTAKITDQAITSYYPGVNPITIKIVVDRETRRLLGAQLVGKSEVAKRVDTLATAITARMTIDQIAQLDLSYTPPYAPLWDPILIAMNAGIRQLEKG